MGFLEATIKALVLRVLVLRVLLLRVLLLRVLLLRVLHASILGLFEATLRDQWVFWKPQLDH